MHTVVTDLPQLHSVALFAQMIMTTLSPPTLDDRCYYAHDASRVWRVAPDSVPGISPSCLQSPQCMLQPGPMRVVSHPSQQQSALPPADLPEGLAPVPS